jgi:molecular chaperone HtpG
MLEAIKEALEGKVVAVKFTDTLGDHPVSLSSEGGISTEMEKVLGRMPGSDEMGMAPKAQTVLQINVNHSVKEALFKAFGSDREKLTTYAKVLYAQARLVCGLSVENPTELSALVCSLM